MIRVHYSNRLENLIAPLAGAISKQQRLAPLTRIPIIVPGRAIEHYLKHRLSEAIGVAANLDFPFLRVFLRRIVEAADPKSRILDVEELELVLFEVLRRAVRDNAPGLEAPRGYIEAASDTDRELRAFNLAGQIARLFREYSITRQPMLRRWTNSSRADTEASETEHWQRHLYRSIFDATGHLRNEWKNNAELNWMLLPDAFEAVAQSSELDLRGPLHVFGLAYAGPAYARIFARLGELRSAEGEKHELNIYALNPCMEFWEDVDQLSGIERAAWARRNQRIGATLEDAEDPFALDVAGDTPALRLWGRPGREYIRLLNELTDCDFDAHFTHHDLTATTSLLGHVQESILNREPERVPMLDNDGLADDGSIRFLACPGIAREVEIVANEIWSMLDPGDRGSDPIRFHEIAVIAPDSSYHDYLPHIEAAFSRSHQLPINVVNRGASSASPIREAISLLLRLPLGRFSRDEMLHLLEHPAVRSSDAETGLERWSKRCEALGVFFGADQEDLADTYIPRDIFHWDQALRRLALGVFMGAEADHQPRFYRSSDGAEYLPYQTSQDEVDGVASFIKTARALLLDAMEIRSRRLTLTEWSHLLGDLILTHIHTSDAADERARERCILAIESIARSDLQSEPLSYQVAYETVFDRLSEVESQLGQFAEHGVVVGPLSALRAIPFKVSFLLGLDESRFPEQTRRDPMDLRSVKRRAGDVSPTERDRYLFLETLLAARERIFLCYVARDFKTGDQLEPASIVRELQYILRGYVDSDTLKQLTIVHPLSRYDSIYFPELGPANQIATRPLVSFDREARRAARMAALRQDLKRHCGDFPLPGRDDPIVEQLGKAAREQMRSALRMLELPKSPQSDDTLAPEISLPISALRKFLECPLQGAAQYALGIFEDESEDSEDYQDEPIAQSILDRTMMLREAFWKARGEPEHLSSEYSKTFKLAQTHGQAPAGPFADAAKIVDLASLEEWIEQARLAGCEDLAQWREIQLGRAAEFATSQRVAGELILEVQVPGIARKTQRVKIHGSAGFLSPALDASIRPVLRDKAKAKEFLGPFLSAIVLAAAEQTTAQKFRAIVLCSKGEESSHPTKTLAFPSREHAREYLAALVSDLLFEKNHYFLPIEAVEAGFNAIAKGKSIDPIDLIDEIRDNDFKSCASDFGPIRDARRFEPPNAKALKHILERRFGIMHTLFGKAES
jgi:exodeoxyribonuclease V gamma subunit